MSVDREKFELRRIAKEHRSTWTKTERVEAAENLKKNFQSILDHSNFQTERSTIIAGFWPIADEIDIRPLISELHKTGHLIVLPVVVGKEQPLIFRVWEPKTILEKGSFGTHHPSANHPEAIPTILLVPLLAFDINGQRLGWGGGFYDRTISNFRSQFSIITVGVAYQNQQIDNVPHIPTDEPLDWVVTEISAKKIIKR
jgi:5-formyltetrahydrofolate cyclo-ligase